MRFSISVVALACVTSGLAFATSATAEEFPTRRPGLWEVTINHDAAGAAQTMQQCTDAETDKLMNAFGGDISADLCTRQNVRKVGATIVVNATCQIGPVKSSSESVISGDFNSSYSVKVTSKLEGLPAAAAAAAGGTTTIQARWISACKPDQKPGDIVMGNGKTLNIRDLRKMMSAPKNAPK